jgi:hypothetical protein
MDRAALIKDIAMPPLPTPEEWAHIHHEYENTRRSIEDICLEYRISPNTLRRRVKAWGWTMRHPPISDEGPKAVAPPMPPLPHSPSKTGVNALASPLPLGEVGEQQSCETGEGLRSIESVEPPHPNPLPHSPSKTGVNALMGERERTVLAATYQLRGEPSPHITEPPDTRPAGGRLQGAAARVMRAIETTSARLTAKPVHLRETEMAARALGSLTRTLHELNGLLVQHKALEPKQSVEELRASLSRKLEAIIAERDNPPPENADEASPDDAPASI